MRVSSQILQRKSTGDDESNETGDQANLRGSIVTIDKGNSRRGSTISGSFGHKKTEELMNTTGAISKYQGGVTPFKLMTEDEAKKEKEKNERRKTGKEASAPAWFKKKDIKKDAKTEKDKPS